MISSPQPAALSCLDASACRDDEVLRNFTAEHTSVNAMQAWRWERASFTSCFFPPGETLLTIAHTCDFQDGRCVLSAVQGAHSRVRRSVHPYSRTASAATTKGVTPFPWSVLHSPEWK